MDAIVLELVGGKIAITFRPEIGQPATCHIDLTSTLELSCLMLRGGNLKSATTITSGDIELQVENGRKARAWLSISRGNGPDLVACIEGPSVREIGRRLHDHWLTATGTIRTGPERSIFVRPVAFFIDGEEVEAGSMG